VKCLARPAPPERPDFVHETQPTVRSDTIVTIVDPADNGSKGERSMKMKNEKMKKSAAVIGSLVGMFLAMGSAFAESCDQQDETILQQIKAHGLSSMQFWSGGSVAGGDLWAVTNYVTG